MELNAAVTAVRLYRLLIHEIDLPIEKTFFWTDSTLTLQYVSNRTQRFKVFVNNRVAEILSASEVEQWCYVPGVQNPADLVTRGISNPSKLMQTNKFGTNWFTGPAFLEKDESAWPHSLIGDLHESNPEIKKKDVLVAFGVVHQELINPARFSSWVKLKRVEAWLLRFLFNCRSQQNEGKLIGELSCEEIKKAQLILIRNLQQVVFFEELSILQKNGSLPRNHYLASLSPFVDQNGTLRVGGRLKKANIPHDSKHQSILPKDHPITKMIISHEHRSNGHIGAEHVLANLRQSFWFVNGRAAIRSTLRKCFLCRVRRARVMYPYMADLPEGRLAFDEPPFANCGVDLFGPLMIKQGRKRLKRWGVLFTCLTVRCIHLEVVDNGIQIPSSIP